MQFYGGAIPSSVTSTYTGPYNLYSGASSISLGAHTTFAVDTTQSSSGNDNIFSTYGPNNNSPTILTNSFSFSDPSTTTLNINTPLIAMHSSIGGFGHIGISGTPSLVINALDGATTISGIWDSNAALLFLLSDTTITDPSIASNFANNGLYISFVYPLGNSTLILDSSGTTTGNSIHFFSPDTGIGGNVILSAGIGNSITIDSGTAQGASNGQFGSFGFYDYDNTGIIARLQSLSITGTEQIDVIMPVYSQTIAFNSMHQSILCSRTGFYKIICRQVLWVMVRLLPSYKM